MWSPNLVQVTESILGSVVPLAMFSKYILDRLDILDFMDFLDHIDGHQYTSKNCQKPWKDRPSSSLNFSCCLSVPQRIDPVHTEHWAAGLLYILTILTIDDLSSTIHLSIFSTLNCFQCGAQLIQSIVESWPRPLAILFHVLLFWWLFILISCPPLLVNLINHHVGAIHAWSIWSNWD